MFKLIDKFRKIARGNLLLRKFIAYYVVPSGLFDTKVLKLPISDYYKRRIVEVVSCPDNKRIPRVKDAGIVQNGKQIMHNGLKIHLGSYYGPEIAQQMFKNRGVHEPQEEFVFQEVLKGIKQGALMIELGSFWAFYSMWFNSKVIGAENYMVEPDSFNIGCGKRNFSLNKLKGEFIQAFVGTENQSVNGKRTIGIDDFCEGRKIEYIDILHSDIQGFEFDMLLGASRMLSLERVGYLFISTHSNEIHHKCCQLIKNKGYLIIVDIDLDGTYAEDGLIVAKSKNYVGIEKIEVSNKRGMC